MQRILVALALLVNGAAAFAPRAAVLPAWNLVR